MSASRSPSPGQPSAAPGGDTQALYNRVFGGDDSDVSDIESGDEDAHHIPKPRRAFPPRADPAVDDTYQETREGSQSVASRADEDSAERDGRDHLDEEEGDEAEDDNSDVYVPGTANEAAKIPKFKKSKPTTSNLEADSEDDQDGTAARLESKKRKKKQKDRRIRKEKHRDQDEEAEDEEAPPVLDAETQRRIALEARMDNIGKGQKKIKRRKKDDEEVADAYLEELCNSVRDRMIAAAEKDRVSLENKMPATAKLAMLEDVMGVLRNTTLWQPIQDSGLLEAVALWLKPIEPSAALPAVGIQKAFFEVLPKLDLDTATLKECRLGPIVLFYTRTKRVQPIINRQADALVQAWSRPIINRPANFRSRHIQTAAEVNDRDGGSARERPRASGQTVNKERFNVEKAVLENIKRKGARLTIAKDIQYTLAPESRLVHNPEDLQHVTRIQMDNRKFNKFASKLKASKSKA